ncbi:MAG: HRDC domain-containing protein, partial [Clostridiales bacterium]|nr:HRDC domain-containing protein [Clostridiales bacterium]
VEMENAFIGKYKNQLASEGETNIIDYSADKIEIPLKESSKDILKSKTETTNNDAVKEKLVKYRLDQSRTEKIKAYYIFSNKQMDIILEKMPKTKEDLLSCDGFGPSKVDKYGEQIIKILIDN